MADDPTFSSAARQAAARAREQSGLAAEMERQRGIEDVRRSIIAWIETNWKNPRCPMCEANEWVVGELGEIRQHRFGAPGRYGVPDPIMPVVPIVCGNCGNTLFVNAVIAGAVSIPDEEGPYGAAEAERGIEP